MLSWPGYTCQKNDQNYPFNNKSVIKSTKAHNATSMVEIQDIETHDEIHV